MGFHIDDDKTRLVKSPNELSSRMIHWSIDMSKDNMLASIADKNGN